MFLKTSSFLFVLVLFSMQLEADEFDTLLPIASAENPVNLAGESASFLGSGLVASPSGLVTAGSRPTAVDGFGGSVPPAGALIKTPASSPIATTGSGNFAGARLNAAITGNAVNSGNSIRSGNTVTIR